MESLIDLQRLTGDYLWDLGVNIIVSLMILALGRLAANAISGLTSSTSPAERAGGDPG